VKDAALVAREILRLARAELAEILRRLAAETHTQWHAIYVAPRRSERGGRGGALNTRGRCTCFCDQTQKRRIDIAPHRDASARRLTKRRYLHIATTSPCHGHTARTYWRSFANRMPAQTRDVRRAQTQKSVRVQSQQGGTLGTTSLKSSKTMRPAGLPSMAQSKKTFGLPAAAAAAKGRAHAGGNRACAGHPAAGDSARPRGDAMATLVRAVRESTCRGGKHSGAGEAARREALSCRLREHARRSTRKWEGPHTPLSRDTHVRERGAPSYRAAGRRRAEPRKGAQRGARCECHCRRFLK
jgi:hypothetical protein